MIKKTAAFTLACCFFLAALPFVLHAAQLSGRQQLVNKSIGGLQDRIAADAGGMDSPLSAATVEFLDELKNAGASNSDIELAGFRYVDALEQQVEAQAFDPVCAGPLLISISINGTSILQELASLDAPVCKTLSLANKASVIMSAKYSYDICVIDNSEIPNEAAREEIVRRQQGVKLFNFSTTALDLALCTPAATLQDYLNLLLNFLGLFSSTAE